MTFDPASRYRLVEQAEMLPGTCLISKTDKGPFVDTGIELNKFDSIWSGANQARIYLSVAVIRELAEGAGLFDEVREHAIPESVSAYQRGFNEGVETHGDLAALAARLDLLAARLRSGGRVSEPILASGEGGDEPPILVTDGTGDRERPSDEPGADASDGAPGGQGDGPRRNRRPAGVSAGPSDGRNPFRL